MNVLVVGSGGREFTLVWKIFQSPEVNKIYCAPGNDGMQEWAELVPIKANAIEELKKFALKNKIDLTIVGPEDPLCDGIVDEFEKAGLKAFGPSKLASQLEGRKSFSKGIMTLNEIPTAAYVVFEEYEKALEHVKKVGAPVVIKADGLAAGKGVYVCQTIEEAMIALKEIMVDKKYKAAGDRVVIEEFLEGEEASFLVFTDGENVIPLESSQDHKAVYEDENDRRVWNLCT